MRQKSGPVKELAEKVVKDTAARRGGIFQRRT